MTLRPSFKSTLHIVTRPEVHVSTQTVFTIPGGGESHPTSQMNNNIGIVKRISCTPTVLHHYTIPGCFIQ